MTKTDPFMRSIDTLRLSAKTMVAITCCFCGEHTQFECYGQPGWILYNKGWRALKSKVNGKFYPACPLCVGAKKRRKK